MVTPLAQYRFWRACQVGDLAGVREEAEGLTREVARAMDNKALRVACGNGHLEVAQWLAARFALTAEDAREYNNGSLGSACANGHLAVAQWLVSHFALTAEDARADDNYALRWAREGGHEEVVHWLAEAGGYAQEGMGLGAAWAQWASRKNPLVKSAAFGV